MMVVVVEKCIHYKNISMQISHIGKRAIIVEVNVVVIFLVITNKYCDSRNKIYYYSRRDSCSGDF